MAVTVEHVRVSVGRPLTTFETDQATLWISDALVLIGARATRERTNLASLDQGSLDMVVREAVAARIKKPDDATQVSVSVDDGQMSRTYKSATGQIEITDAWWELLFPSGSGEAFSVPLGYRPPRHHHHDHEPLSQPFWDVN